MNQQTDRYIQEWIDTMFYFEIESVTANYHVATPTSV